VRRSAGRSLIVGRNGRGTAVFGEGAAVFGVRRRGFWSAAPSGAAFASLTVARGGGSGPDHVVTGIGWSVVDRRRKWPGQRGFWSAAPSGAAFASLTVARGGGSGPDHVVTGIGWSGVDRGRKWPGRRGFWSAAPSGAAFASPTVARGGRLGAVHVVTGIVWSGVDRRRERARAAPTGTALQIRFTPGRRSTASPCRSALGYGYGCAFGAEITDFLVRRHDLPNVQNDSADNEDQLPF
jgi:hypothetical protein